MSARGVDFGMVEVAGESQRKGAYGGEGSEGAKGGEHES